MVIFKDKFSNNAKKGTSLIGPWHKLSLSKVQFFISKTSNMCTIFIISVMENDVIAFIQKKEILHPGRICVQIIVICNSML